MIFLSWVAGSALLALYFWAMLLLSFFSALYCLGEQRLQVYIFSYIWVYLTKPIIINTTYTLLNDHELWQYIRQGDEVAFEVLYDRYWWDLINHAFKRLRDKSRAEDLVQDIFVDLYNRRNVLEEVSSPQGYLFAALKYKILNAIRQDIMKMSKLETLATTLQKDTSAAPAPLQKLMDDEWDTQISSAITKLPPKCRTAFQLRYHENLSYKSIAARMGVSVNTIEKQIVKAHKFLRAQLNSPPADCLLPLLCWLLLR